MTCRLSTLCKVGAANNGIVVHARGGVDVATQRAVLDAIDLAGLGALERIAR
jgi:hypothetical protein